MLEIRISARTRQGARTPHHHPLQHQRDRILEPGSEQEQRTPQSTGNALYAVSRYLLQKRARVSAVMPSPARSFISIDPVAPRALAGMQPVELYRRQSQNQLSGILIVTLFTKPVKSESSTSLKTRSADWVDSSLPTSAVSSAEYTDGTVFSTRPSATFLPST